MTDYAELVRLLLEYANDDGVLSRETVRRAADAIESLSARNGELTKRNGMLATQCDHVAIANANLAEQLVRERIELVNYARRMALEEAAKIAEETGKSLGTLEHATGWEIAIAIRALMEKEQADG